LLVGVEQAKETKIPYSSLLINDHLHPPTILGPAAPWDRKEKREAEEKEERGERNMDFNALLIPL
jgi:hypothetical protein